MDHILPFLLSTWDWLTNGTNLAAVVAAGTAVGALIQFNRNSRRQRIETEQRMATVAQSEMLSFLSDQRVQRALSGLDYAEPETIAALVAHSASHDTLPGQSSIKEVRAARDDIDRMLERLEMIDFLIEHEVIDDGDFEEHFAYWLELLCEHHAPGDRLLHLTDEQRAALWNYIRTYRYTGIERLFRRYGRFKVHRPHQPGEVSVQPSRHTVSGSGDGAAQGRVERQ